MALWYFTHFHITFEMVPFVTSVFFKSYYMMMILSWIIYVCVLFFIHLDEIYDLIALIISSKKIFWRSHDFIKFYYYSLQGIATDNWNLN